MKKLLFSAFLLLILSSCSSLRYSAVREYPDCPDEWTGSLTSWYYFCDCVGDRWADSDCERCYFQTIKKFHEFDH